MYWAQLSVVVGVFFPPHPGPSSLGSFLPPLPSPSLASPI